MIIVATISTHLSAYFILYYCIFFISFIYYENFNCFKGLYLETIQPVLLIIVGYVWIINVLIHWGSIEIVQIFLFLTYLFINQSPWWNLQQMSFPKSNTLVAEKKQLLSFPLTNKTNKYIWVSSPYQIKFTASTFLKNLAPVGKGRSFWPKRWAKKKEMKLWLNYYQIKSRAKPEENQQLPKYNY